ncbi:tryptophan halogenase family protein [Mucilaginibacter sp. KACC 22063]|uniref:tryptophan halogenase family protein n=1 Tax=Mucilaginibacter sp. KACC 22063 TaxID=3025666 RepID=UPI0023665416|nr:tryptophan halogenase family protein [Mucilaginibacter sp. KACC 22063]WDF56228.1 tryptophan 7-halogenase [Mucilaginibacter sp. KACC 22063]
MEHEYLSLLKNFKESKLKMDQYEPFYWNLQLEDDRLYKSIGILGGGLAGYLTAIAFKKFFNLPVTVIESSKIPPIGVGEATTPIMQDYLFDSLGLDKAKFYDKVEPTWKLGIKFFWGLPGDYYFNYPFDGKDILSAMVHNQDINHSSLNSMMMSNDASFVAKITDGEKSKYHSLSKSLKYAYHLDNKKFIAYLKEEAMDAGVIFLDENIADAKINSETGDIECLISEGGQHFKFDFYIDCSGFKSQLLEKKMGTAYVSYKSSLYNDSAIVSEVPNFGNIKCYTTAESMNNGWCWNIPLRHEDHRGYVFSSDFCSDDEAYEEMLLKNPTMSKDTRVIRFRSGRHTEFIKGNVAGIGNSYAFVEPLESTGVHMIIEEIIMLLNNFINLKGNPTLRTVLNKNMNDHWDYLRYFLSIHFKFNRKFDTAYWKACRDRVDSSGFETFINLYKEIGFLTKQDTTVKNVIKTMVKDNLFDLYGIDHILLGQGILPKDLHKIQLDNKKEWDRTVEDWNQIIKYLVPLKDDLEILLEHQDLI